MENPASLRADNTNSDSSDDKKLSGCTAAASRRSAVFKRQSLAPSTDQDLESTDSTAEVKHELKRLKLQPDPPPAEFDLRRYIDQLRSEDRNWREVNSRRKAELQSLVRTERTLQQTGQKLDLNCLTDAERAFLAARPDYDEFAKNVRQLHARALNVAQLRATADTYRRRAGLRLEESKARVETRVIQLSNLCHRAST